jgi:MFS family permease
MSRTAPKARLAPPDVVLSGTDPRRAGTLAQQAFESSGVLTQEAEATLPARSPSFPLFSWEVPLPSSLRALAHRNFRLFWSGQLISLVGTWMQAIARAWLVLELTHSAFWLGMVGFANAVPVMLLSLWGGVVADRVAKRTLIIWTQTLSMLLAFVLAALTLTNTVQLWHVLAVSLALGAVNAFDGPARQTFTVDMVGKEDLMNAVALNSSIFNGARVMGPAIGAIALTAAGPGMAFLLNGVSFLAVIYGLLRMDITGKPLHREGEDTSRRLAEGLSYLRKDTTMAAFMGIVAIVSIFAFPYSVMMPVFADSVLHVGEQGYGTLMTFAGIGSLIGAITLTVQSGRSSTKRGRIVLAGAIGLPLSLAVFSLSGAYLLSLIMLVAVGYCMISVNTSINTIIQTNVPDSLRGRVNGVYSLLFMGVAPLGNLQAGVLADRFGAPFSLFVGALVTALFVAFVLLTRRRVFSVA